MCSRTIRITLLADEWKSSKGGLSTMNRELAIHLARHPITKVTFFVPKCTEDDEREARKHNITIKAATERPGFDPLDWLCFPPKDLDIDIIIGHGMKLGKQAQVIRESHHCAWIQVVHTVPEKLSMFKTYPDAISKGDEKQWTEVYLCKIADLVVAVGPKLHEHYSVYLRSCRKYVFNLTPGIFSELSCLNLSTQLSKEFRVLVFGRGDSEDFELKGFDIAAQAVAELNDRSYHLIFVGAMENEKEVAEKLLAQGISRSQLTVKGYVENRDDLAMLLFTANLVIMPSRTEGFGLTALEALSAGLPLLVSQNSGFGEALQEIPSGSSWIIDSEEPKPWAEAIKGVREKGSETALKECQALRTRYAGKYSWDVQCNDLVGKMLTLIHDTARKVDTPSQNRIQIPYQKSDYFNEFLKEREKRKIAEQQKLEVELCRRRDELYKYRFGDKIRLDSFRGLSIEDVTCLRIGVFGCTGAGISSFINTCERVVRQTEMGAAVFGGYGSQVTTTLQDYLPEMFFRLVDTSGFFEHGSKSMYIEFLDILFGKLQPGDKIVRRYNPEYDIDVSRVGDKEYQCPVFGERIHGVIFVIKVDPRLECGYYKDCWKSFRDVLRKVGIAPVVVVTHHDKLREEQCRDVLDKASVAAGSSSSDTFLVWNYTEVNSVRNLETDRTILEILHCALTKAEQAVKTMKQNVAQIGTTEGRIEEQSPRRDTHESEERQQVNDRLQQEICILNEKEKAEEDRQQAEYQQQQKREMKQEQARRREDELKHFHLQVELCQCRSELNRLKERERARGEITNILDDKKGRELKQLQEQFEEEIYVISQNRKADEEKRQWEESQKELQRERELEEVKRRQENLKRLQLDAELCRRRDELFNYRFGEKLRLDCLQGIQIDDVTQLRIGVVGPPGSGKSCFINTCQQALKLTETRVVLDSTTEQEGRISVQAEYLPEMFFHLVEIRGLFGEDCVNIAEFRNMMLGETQSVDEEIHGIIFVFKANDPQLYFYHEHEQLRAQLQDYRREIEFEPITVLTHRDKLGTYEECRNALQEASYFSRCYPQYSFAVSNYTEKNNDQSLETEQTIFNVLHFALMEAERGVMIKKQREKRKRTLMDSSP